MAVARGVVISIISLSGNDLRDTARFSLVFLAILAFLPIDRTFNREGHPYSLARLLLNLEFHGVVISIIFG